MLKDSLSQIFILSAVVSLLTRSFDPFQHFIYLGKVFRHFWCLTKNLLFVSIKILLLCLGVGSLWMWLTPANPPIIPSIYYNLTISDDVLFIFQQGNWESLGIWNWLNMRCLYSQDIRVFFFFFCELDVENGNFWNTTIK